MPDSKLIHQFVDGELDPTREEEFFLGVYNDEELRTELKQLMELRNASRSNLDVFTPPAESTSAVFGALGFNGIMNTPAPGFFVRTGNFIKHNSKLMLTGFLSSLITGITVFLLMLNINDNAVSSDDVVMNWQNSQNGAIQNSIPVVVSESNVEVSKLDLLKGNSSSSVASTNPFTIAASVDSKEDYSGTDQNFQALELPANVFASMNTTYYRFGDIAVNNRFDAMPFGSEKTDYMIERNKKWHFEGLSFINNYSQNNAVSPESQSAFDNLSFALFYDASDKFSVGIDYRGESFYNSFEARESDGVLYRYETHPVYNSLALALRYYPVKDYFSFSPFIQASLGGNQAGIVARGGAGLMLNLYGNLNFVFGAEYSNLSFDYNNTLYHSGKWIYSSGINFGF